MRAQHMGPQLGSLLQQTQSLLHSFIRTSFQFIHRSVLTPTIPRIYFKTFIGFGAMITNNLMSLPKSSSPLDYPILKPSVLFISLYDSFEADLIHSLGTLTLTDIDHVSIIKSSVSPTSKRGGITRQSDPKHACVHEN